MLTKRAFIRPSFLFKKNEPKVPIVSWYLLIYSVEYLLNACVLTQLMIHLPGTGSSSRDDTAGLGFQSQ